MSDDDDAEEAELWERTVWELLQRGERITTAVEAARLVLQGHRRKREESAQLDPKQSGTVKRHKAWRDDDGSKTG
jgi:hypothetical protein